MVAGISMLYEILGSHEGEYEDYDRLEYDAV
jgi:hypothetical protein